MKNNTVFIIGAGASKEANLSTGEELKDKISTLLDIRFDTWGERVKKGDVKVAGAFRKHAQLPNGLMGNLNPFLDAAWHIRDAMPLAESIDNFIDDHKENDLIALCGKLAIVRSILMEENQSLLFPRNRQTNQTIDLSSLNKTWYPQFFKLLIGNCEKQNLIQRFKNVTLIIFNYDRCVEQFLFHALKIYYKINDDAAAKLISSLNIYHPYGKIGTLPWENRIGFIDFGATPSADNLLTQSRQIRTFTEGVDPSSSDIVEIRNHIINAPRLVFLGFAFHPLNMKLLEHEESSEKKKSPFTHSYATTFGISDSGKEVVRGRIGRLNSSGNDISMVNKSCADFFNEFWMRLSF